MSNDLNAVIDTIEKRFMENEVNYGGDVYTGLTAMIHFAIASDLV